LFSVMLNGLIQFSMMKRLDDDWMPASAKRETGEISLHWPRVEIGHCSRN